MGYNEARVKPTILILESNMQASDIISFELSRSGYYLIRAYNGREGLQRLHMRKPDILLLDIFMSGKSGIEAAHIIKSI